MSNIRRFSLLCSVIVIVAILLAGCGTVSTPSVTTNDYLERGTATIKVTADKNSLFAQIADSAVVTITGDNMYLMKASLTVTDSSIEGTVKDIPAGKNRTIAISVYDSMKTLQYSGSAEVTVTADTTTAVKINIVRVKGSIAVTGIVIDTSNQLNRGLVALYPFSGNTRDASGMLNDGTPIGARLTTDRFGIDAAAFQFNGTSDYIQVPYHKSIDLENMLTVAAWAKSDVPGKDYSYTAVVLQMGTGSELAYGIYYNQNLDVMEFGYRCHWTGDSIIDGGVRTESALDTSWHFYAMTFDGDSLRGYVDGEPAGSFKALEGAIDNLPLRIGCESKALNRHWKGKIDDVMIYNRALTGKEIAELKALNLN